MEPSDSIETGPNANWELPQDSTSDARQLKLMEARVRRELRRHYLSERERLVADALVEASVGLGLRSVKIPKLEVLSELTGLDRAHVHNALRSLHDMRIVTVRPKEGLFLYTINLNSDSWKVKPRVALATTLRGLETIRELNGVGSEPVGGASNFRDGTDGQILLPGVADLATVAGETFPEIN